MTEEEIKYLKKEWIDESDDTNEYCVRSLLVETLRLLEDGDISEATKRLRQVMPFGNQTVTPPDFLGDDC